MSRPTIVCILAAALQLSAATKPDTSVYLGPYTVDVTTTAAKIIWVTTTADDSFALALTPADTAAPIAVKHAAAPGRTERIHVASAQKLKPGTAYQYTLTVKGAKHAGSFRTMPEPGVRSSFVIYGDTRSRPEYHGKIAALIAQEKPLFVACNGDLTVAGDQWDLWKAQFFTPASAYLKSTGFVPIRGNHEQTGALYKAFFDIPAAQDVYSFDCGDAHVLVIDQYADTAAKPLERVRKLVEADLKASKAAWKIVCIHIPVYNIAGHASTWGQKEFLPMFEQTGVDLVMAGHSHLYERFLPIGKPGSRPIIHVVSGGGGVETVDPVPSPILEGGIGLSVTHFCAISVTRDSLSVRVKDVTGKKIDAFDLVKKDGMFQKEVTDRAISDSLAQSLAFVFAKMKVSFDFGTIAGDTASTMELSGFSFGREPAVLTIGAGKSCTGWKIPTQACTLAAGTVDCAIRGHAVNRPRIEGLTIQPPLIVDIAITIAGHTLASKDVPLTVGAATLVAAVPVPRPYLIPHAAKPITVDGILGDWQAIPSMPLPFMKKETSPFRFAWTEQGLYFSYQVKDSTRGMGTVPWEGDGLELFIDKSWARATGWSLTAAQFGFATDTSASGGKAHATVAWGDTAGQHQMSAMWTKEKQGYALEGFVPAKCLKQTKLAAGTTWGFNFARDDNGRAVEQFYCDKDKHQAFITPILWGAVTLAP